MRKRNIQVSNLITLIFLALLSGCNLPARGNSSMPSLSTRAVEWQQTLTPNHETIVIPMVDHTPEPVLVSTDGQFEFTPDEPTRYFLHPGLPQKLISALNIPQTRLTDNQQDADIRLLLGKKDIDQVDPPSSTWVYVLVAPFYTTTDGLSMDNLAALWRGQVMDDLPFTKILVTTDTYAVLSAILGEPDEDIISLVTKDSLNDLALSDQSFLSILPFEELTPHWKVLRIDGQSPIDDSFSPQNYPLSLQIWLEGDPGDQTYSLPTANYMEEMRSVLIMTGVTALTRATAHRMALQGNQYPGTDIQPWLSAADFVHISNEVAFADNCPNPDPFQSDLIFCSSPDRIELLEYVSADIIELSGNHMLDYGVQAMNLTLEMYAERGWVTYAGGWDLFAARSPAKITHNSNKLAFLGCNPVGPPIAWATNSQPGSAPCGDYQWLLDQIRALRADGYLPIVTLQYVEDYTAYPSTQMVADFQRLADAGALIVNGSQAHTPKNMVFYEGSFLHYGLGNLFFDQMEVYYNDYLMPGTREAFIDRLVFYDGQLISVELLTTMLEDYARPRPMTPAEREALLSRIFKIALDAYE